MPVSIFLGSCRDRAKYRVIVPALSHIDEGVCEGSGGPRGTRRNESAARQDHRAAAPNVARMVASFSTPGGIHVSLKSTYADHRSLSRRAWLAGEFKHRDGVKRKPEHLYRGWSSIRRRGGSAQYLELVGRPGENGFVKNPRMELCVAQVALEPFSPVDRGWGAYHVSK